MSALFARILSASHLSRIGVTLVLILTALGVAYPLQPAQAASPLLPSISDFTSIGAGLPTGAYGAVAWGDYDNDGDLDFLFSGFNGSTDITRI